MKKKFLSPKYDLAVLKRLSNRTYIEFYQTNPTSLKKERIRATFNLNRKKYRENEPLLLQRAAEVINQINMSLPFGYPFGVELLSPQVIAQMKITKAHQKVKKKVKKAKKKTTLEMAIRKACRLKCRNASNETIRTYTSSTKLFLLFASERGWQKRCLTKFKSKHAVRYMDYIEHEKKGRLGGQVSPTTWNNNLRDMRAMFAELIRQDIAKENPFGPAVFKYKKRKKLAHKVLSHEDAKVVFRELYNQDKVVFYAVLIQYIGFARPREIYMRLRRRHFDLKNGIIEVPGIDHSKTVDTKYITIPAAFLHFFREDWFSALPNRKLIWGKDLKPHLKIPCGEKSLYARYSNFVKRLYREKMISAPSTQFYDWKRRGITDFIKIVGVRATQRQAGHENIASTVIYDRPDKINERMQKVPNLME